MTTGVNPLVLSINGGGNAVAQTKVGTDDPTWLLDASTAEFSSIS